MTFQRALRKQFPFVRLFAPLVAILAALVFLGQSTSAHEGHDHGPPAPELPTTVKPRITVHSDLYELVAILQGASLSIFLDHYATNEPISDATVSVMSGAGTITAKPRGDGTYRAEVPALAAAGRHELIFTITHAAGEDLLPAELMIPDAFIGGPKIGAAGSSWPQMNGTGWFAAVLALILGLGLGTLAKRRATVMVALLLLFTAASLPLPVAAHEGHEQSPAPSSESLSGDLPRRLPDGSVFLPKPSQRLLTVRSQVAVLSQVPRGLRLVGRIIADPNRSGLVQSIAGGRVSAPEGGLPTLGQSVKKGQLLATITPALPLADQSTLAERQRELEGAMSLARQKLNRLSRLGSASTPRAQIEDIEQEIASLDQRLESLAQAKVRPELLESPIDGIVSASRAVSGQVVQAQDILFQIVDPSSLWVEALLFDPLEPSSLEAASATLPDGKVVALTYKGRGRAVQAQAALIQFAMINPPATSLIGLPVTVFTRGRSRENGILLPRDAVVRGPGGESIVWQHIDPERFVARPVRVEPYDGAQVVITAGIAAKDRIVVHASELLSQVR